MGRLEIKTIKTLSLFFIVFSMSACTSTKWDNQKRIEASPQFVDGRFKNSENDESHMSFSGFIKGLGSLFKEFKDRIPTREIEVKQLDFKDFTSGDLNSFKYTRLGHSTILFQLAGKTWLTDPIFSKRASPVSWAGPKRFHPVPMNIDVLKNIEGVIISHDHYDHLDYKAVLEIKDRVKNFIVPLGVGKRLAEWGVSKEKIHSLDWWEKIQLGDVEVISTPSQHFSGRTPFDTKSTLWSSWVVKTKKHSLFFSGDSGYFGGFKEIGKKYGPFDITFMECGQYNPDWRQVHMMPEDTMKAHIDLKGKLLVPIHNGTFSISMHPWYDPMRQITELGKKNNVKVLIPKMGETIDIKAPPQANVPWWNNKKYTEPKED
jgi:L-ascorbate metabolism protein UlaG (beta-lactamase superfamily)